MGEIAIIGTMILFSAFFSGMEIAFISANKMRLEVEKQKNDLTSGILNIFTSNPQQYIATMLVGNNISLVIYGLAFARLLEPIYADYFQSDLMLLLFKTIFSTIIILVTAEFLPKMVFSLNPTGALKIFAIPVLLFYIILWPISKISIFLSKQIITKILKKEVSSDNEQIAFTRHDLNDYVNQPEHEKLAQHTHEETEVKLFKNALDFSKVKVRDCMIPRAELEALEENETLDEIRKRFIESGFSKILIYSENIDNIYGYVHSSKLFGNPPSIKSITNPITIVPETLPASKLLGIFTQKHKSIALVVDEFGGTSGLVTTEDILEEIFGEIEDEHDTDDLTMKQISEHEWIVSGRFEISLLNEKYGFKLVENDDYDTLAGLILNHHESIPKVNTVINCDYYQFRILKASKTKIELVLIKRIEPDK
jgi:CBS domain containing-hemolysin-like protein